MSWYALNGLIGEQGTPGFTDGPPGGVAGFIVTFIEDRGNEGKIARTRFVQADKKDRVLDFLRSKNTLLKPGEWENFVLGGMVINDRKKLVINILKELYGRVVVRGRKNAQETV